MPEITWRPGGSCPLLLQMVPELVQLLVLFGNQFHHMTVTSLCHRIVSYIPKGQGPGLQNVDFALLLFLIPKLFLQLLQLPFNHSFVGEKNGGRIVFVLIAPPPASDVATQKEAMLLWKLCSRARSSSLSLETERTSPRQVPNPCCVTNKDLFMFYYNLPEPSLATHCLKRGLCDKQLNQVLVSVLETCT